MKRIAVYAPLEYGGINYPSVATIQDQKGIALVMRQLQLGKELSHDLRILIQTAQLESGMINPILDDTDLRLPYLEPGHIMHLRDRLRELNGSIVIEDIWYPTLQREGDVSIMEQLSRLPGVTKRELEHANQCRKYTRVITIAEMASLCGRYIPPDRFNGRWRAKSSLKWTRQPPPTGPMWDKFRQLIKRAFCFKKRNTRIGQLGDTKESKQKGEKKDVNGPHYKLVHDLLNFHRAHENALSLICKLFITRLVY